MKKPVDPREGKRGIVSPSLLIREAVCIAVHDEDLWSTYKIDLDLAYDTWKKAKAKLESEGHRLVWGPYIMGNSIEFTIEKHNDYYEGQLATYNAVIAKYEADLVAFSRYVERKQGKIKEDRDDEIVRLEARLARLKAQG